MKYYVFIFFFFCSCQFAHDKVTKTNSFTEEDFNEVFKRTKSIFSENKFAIENNSSSWVSDSFGTSCLQSSLALDTSFGFQCVRVGEYEYKCDLYTSSCGLHYEYAEKKFLNFFFRICARKDYGEIKKFADECMFPEFLINPNDNYRLLEQNNLFIYFPLPENYKKTNLEQDIRKCEKLINEYYLQFLKKKGIKID